MIGLYYIDWQKKFNHCGLISSVKRREVSFKSDPKQRWQFEDRILSHVQSLHLNSCKPFVRILDILVQGSCCSVRRWVAYTNNNIPHKLNRHRNKEKRYRLRHIHHTSHPPMVQLACQLLIRNRHCESNPNIFRCVSQNRTLS